MFARVSTAQTTPDSWDESLAIWREQVLPRLRQQQGFKGIVVFGDRKTNKAGSVTLWETEADAEASRNSGQMRDALASLAPVLAGQPTMEHHEVAILEIV